MGHRLLAIQQNQRVNAHTSHTGCDLKCPFKIVLSTFWPIVAFYAMQTVTQYALVIRQALKHILSLRSVRNDNFMALIKTLQLH